MVHAAGTGALLTLLAADDRDEGLAEAVLDPVLDAVLPDAPDARGDDGPASDTVAFRTVVDLWGLTAAERALLAEWVDRRA